MNKRIGDRRGRQRFEIVGHLTGTLEIWQPLPIINMSAAGALIETASSYTVGDRLSGRLLYRGRGRDVRAEVRRVTPIRGDQGQRRYLVALEWAGSVDRIEELLAIQPHDGRTGGRDVDRRRGQRVNCLGQAEIGQPRWTTVELVDISGSGVLFLSPDQMTVGDKGRLKVRLGDEGLTVEIEVRREESRFTDGSRHRIGAAFVSLDEANRLRLEGFVGDRRP